MQKSAVSIRTSSEIQTTRSCDTNRLLEPHRRACSASVSSRDTRFHELVEEGLSVYPVQHHFTTEEYTCIPRERFLSPSSHAMETKTPNLEESRNVETALPYVAQALHGMSFPCTQMGRSRRHPKPWNLSPRSSLPRTFPVSSPYTASRYSLMEEAVENRLARG